MRKDKNKLENKIRITKTGVVFVDKTIKPKIEVRKYGNFKNFFRENKLKINPTLYFIYRGAYLGKDKGVFDKNKLRYDLTLILPGRIGQEANRTIGHKHKKISGGKLPLSEIYQVISGRALFIIQNKKDMFVVERKKGEKIIIPPEAGHITINPSLQNPLLIANIFSSLKNSSDYSFFLKNGGPAFYPVFSGKKIAFKKNQNWRGIALRKINQIAVPFGLDNKKSLYQDFLDSPSKFQFVNKPDSFKNKFSTKNLFS